MHQMRIVYWQLNVVFLHIFFQEDARQRKLVLEQILDEHAQIVTVVRQASSESNNDAFQSAQVPRDQ